MDDPTLEQQVRVILVGRTGLDAALRLDPGVELLRVRTPLEAIGELSDPIDDLSPARAVIVVGADAEPGLRAGAPGGREEFLKAARLVDPTVRVLRAGDRAPAPDADSSRGYDGVVDPAASAQTVSLLVRAATHSGTEPARTAAPSRPEPVVPARVAPSAPRPPVPEPLAPAPAATHQRPVRPPAAPVEAAPGVAHARAAPANFADAALVRTMLRGGDVAGAALELVRSRTSDPGVRFIARGEAAPEGLAPVAVACEGVTYGHLWSDRTLAEELRVHAEWLAAWMRLADQQAQLRRAAFTDPLTGAWNRRYFDRYLSAIIQRARAARQAVTVMCFDIDDFKRFNDVYGHAAADEILIETVRLLRSVIRPSDRVCRVGGDEFAVIFHEPGGPRKPGSAPPATVFDIARRFQEQIAQSRFPKLGLEAPGTLTVSGGLATFPWDGSTPEELIRHADLLAMESKRAGKNAIVFGPGGPRA